MSKKIIMILVFMTAVIFSVYAYDSEKPETHDSQWIQGHGKAYEADSSECMYCHKDRVTCITCHQESRPRSHNASWKRKTHTYKARWDRESCMACHREDSCIECHKSTPPMSHRPGWGGTGDSQNRHCKSCHYPIQETTCYVCHASSHSPRSY